MLSHNSFHRYKANKEDKPKVERRIHFVYNDPITVQITGGAKQQRLAVNAALCFVDETYPGPNRRWDHRLLSVSEIFALQAQVCRDLPKLLNVPGTPNIHIVNHYGCSTTYEL